MIEKVRTFLSRLAGKHGGSENSSPTHRASGVAYASRILATPLPEQIGWRHLLGGVAIFLFAIQVVTGTLLGAYYHPTLEPARDSVEYIMLHVSYGWLIRSVHVWAGELLVAVMAFHMIRIMVDRAHRSGRSANWAVGALLMVLIVAFRFTGHVLPADNTAYWSANAEARIIGSVPLVGGAMQSVLYGGQGFTARSISRLNTLHTLILPWITFFCVTLHLYLVRRNGIARRWTPDRTDG